MFNKDLYQTIRLEGQVDEIERKGPFECTRKGAWLGSGCYYWETFIGHAHWWGQTAHNGNYFICKTCLSISHSKLYDLENSETLQEFDNLRIELEEIFPKPITIPFILQYLQKKGLLSNYSAIRARFLNSIRKNAKDHEGNPITSFIYPNDSHQACIELKPQIQVCLKDKSVLGQRNYRVIYPRQCEGYI
ncbi:hypothetical protein [Porphyromonas gulae]|uniref:hypothetical protein n=1 Tax=Porphyromonas gulae TaxID=111105 RepID=UPI0026F21A65|nr:hypothetical protein [Porphyromonas gulae]